ncbi:MAG: double-strand break repair helicase AddA [Alphaproteobacteria bacterium]|nr:double-strand break repair helicase AddA [Alphaproteobacteria bacterium]
MMSNNTYEDLYNESKEKASERQRKAANPRVSVWVEASAGTGKTQVLSDRVLRLLLESTEPQSIMPKILCLTYTKAAAVEMKTRISERLSKWSVQSDEELKENIENLLGKDTCSQEKLSEYADRAGTLFAMLLDTPGGIKIQTIHSFCEQILKRFPLEAGISPYFEILGEREAAETLKQIQNEILRESNFSDTPEALAVLYLTANLSEHSFPKVMKHITENYIKINESLHQYGGLNKILEKMRQKWGITDGESDEKIIAEAMRNINKNDLEQNIKALRKGGNKNNTTANILQEVLSGGLICGDFDKYASCFLSKSDEIFGQNWRYGDKDAVKSDAEIIDRMKTEAQRLYDVQKKRCKIRIYESSKAFLTVAQSINRKYEEYKRAKSYLDYADLIDKTCALLSDAEQASWVLYKLDGGIDHILLDEAQDTSPQQWKIIEALSNEFFSGSGVREKIRTVFAVGDRKQSIFSFQGADPQKFDEMSREFKKRAGVNFDKIDMEYSFRSTPAILDGVNTIFADEKIADGVISAGSPVEHIPVRAGEYGRVEIWPLYVAEKSEKASEDEKLMPPMEMSKKISVRTKMARQIAEKIEKMIESSKDTVNPLRYKDFMILVRHRNAFMEEFIRVCKENHINIVGADKMVLAEQIAVQDLISLGKFLLLPDDDLSLAETLKSPLFNLTDADLEVLCCERQPNASLWNSLGKNAKYAGIYKDLSRLIEKLDFIRPFELFNYVLVNMGGRHKFMQRMGIEAEDAIDEFMNITLEYEQTQTPNLQGFISWFEDDETAIKREGDDAENDAVRLMTVHHSKGLQARVVFLPDSVQLPKNSCEQKLLFGNDGLPYYPLRKKDYDDICVKINDDDGIVQLEEYRRLLYVALTRAEEQLIICGYANSDKIKDDSWLKICKNAIGKIIAENEDKKLVMESPAKRIVKPKTKYIIQPLIKEKEKWLDVKVNGESAMARPYTPSKLKKEKDEEPDSVSPLKEKADYYRRGKLIHKIIQFLPAENKNKEQIIDDYLQKNAGGFSKEQKQKIKSEVLQLLAKEEYAAFFGSDSHAEVPIFGAVGGQIISAQIDRLIVRKDKVIIIDFKTNREVAKNADKIPELYRRQLKAYEKLVCAIYPNRKAESYILWTNELRLMRVL